MSGVSGTKGLSLVAWYLALRLLEQENSGSESKSLLDSVLLSFVLQVSFAEYH